jgi:hypothetical protein
VSWTVCGLPLALSLTLSVPFRLPLCVGVKATEMEQLAPIETLLPQLLLCAKSPVTPMLEIRSTAFPLLLRITVRGALVVPTV